ncbi:hypothetical protein C8T65DRAFT_619472 [Cerioporus squamosus]|nr:hypothetical protein C8T65DRAFT_619472 [Cerioporus squamosus]
MEPEPETWQTYPAVRLPIAGREAPSCDHCKREGTTETLKRCGGCSTMLYCSRECQKAAWPTHKNHCRRPQRDEDQEVDPAVPPSPLNVAKMVLEWFSAHIESFKILTNSTVQLDGGNARALSEPRAFVCTLTMRQNWDGNPATPFHLISYKLTHRDDADMLQGQWDDLMASRKKSEEAYNVAQNPRMAGIIPIVFDVMENDGYFVNNYMPVFCTRSADDTTLPRRTGQALIGMMVHSKQCINSGLVYAETKESSDEDVIMDIGRYKRKGKKWKWVKHRRDDSELKEMWAQTVALTRGMTPPQIWTIYNDWMGMV